MWYVTMTDKFFSHARRKTSKLVFVCETLKEAEIVEENAINRKDQKYINIRSTYPYEYRTKGYSVDIKTKTEYPSWFEKGYF